MTQVLDKGYVNLVESWGSDEQIIEAARMSTNKGFQGWDDSWICKECKLSFCIDMGTCKGCGGGLRLSKGDLHLLKYLWTNNHHTPFEMAGATFEIYAPIFVIREWHRHRTFSYNEMSGRYTELPNDYYIPSVERFMGAAQGQRNKQGSESGFGETEAIRFQDVIADACIDARGAYRHLLDAGVAREVARMVLPVNQYSRFRASGNLRNWCGFLRLRLDKAAQFEIRSYAKVVAAELRQLFPRTMGLFDEEIHT